MFRSLTLTAALTLGLAALLPSPAAAQTWRAYSGYGNYNAGPFVTYSYSTSSYTPAYSTYYYTPAYTPYYYTPYYYTPVYTEAYLPWTVANYVPAPTIYRPTYLDPTWGYYYNVPTRTYNYYPAARSVYYTRAGTVLYR
jgi:hypothetical protein